MTLAADPWTRTDVLAVLAIVAALAAVPATLWVVRYKVKVRMYRDPTGVVLVKLKNRGRQPASLGPVQRVVRMTAVGRALRFVRRIDAPIVPVATAYPDATVILGPNEIGQWYLGPDTQEVLLLPRARKPLSPFELRSPRPDETVVEILAGARRTRYARRCRQLPDPISTVPTIIAETLKSDAPPAADEVSGPAPVLSPPPPQPNHPRPGGPDSPRPPR